MARAALYGPLLQSIANGEVDLDTHAIKVLLVTSAYTFNQDTHRYLADITNEITGTGYTAGGATLGSKTVTYDSATNTLRFDAADTVWPGATLVAAGAVVYDDSGSKPLLVWIDFDADLAPTDGAFTIAWAAAGVFTVSAGALA